MPTKTKIDLSPELLERIYYIGVPEFPRLTQLVYYRMTSDYSLYMGVIEQTRKNADKWNRLNKTSGSLLNRKSTGAKGVTRKLLTGQLLEELAEEMRGQGTEALKDELVQLVEENCTRTQFRDELCIVSYSDGSRYVQLRSEIPDNVMRPQISGLV